MQRITSSNPPSRCNRYGSIKSLVFLKKFVRVLLLPTQNTFFGEATGKSSRHKPSCCPTREQLGEASNLWKFGTVALDSEPYKSRCGGQYLRRPTPHQLLKIVPSKANFRPPCLASRVEMLPVGYSPHMVQAAVWTSACFLPRAGVTVLVCFRKAYSPP